MSRTDFLDTLCLSDFGKIICVNLYRSLRVGTITESVIKAFLDACVASHMANVAAHPSDPSEDIAFRVATDWSVRENFVKSNIFPTPLSTNDPIQFATVLPVEVFTKHASSSKHVTYSHRKIANET